MMTMMMIIDKHFYAQYGRNINRRVASAIGGVENAGSESAEPENAEPENRKLTSVSGLL